MEYKDITLESIEESLKTFFPPTERRVMLRTGVGGMDLFEEAMEKSIGFSRIYIGKKVPRWLRIKKFTILKSHSGRWYRRIGKINLVD